MNEPLPRFSVSTESGQSIDIGSEQGDEDDVLYKGPPTPHVLPPVAFSDESFSDSLLPQLGSESNDGGLGRSNTSKSRTSMASKRSSVYTEIKGKSALSESTTLQTLDEIAAEVESRRSISLSGDGKTEEGAETTLASGGESATLVDDEDEVEEEEEDDGMDEDEEYEDDDSDAATVPEDVIEEEEDIPVPGSLSRNDVFF